MYLKLKGKQLLCFILYKHKSFMLWKMSYNYFGTYLLLFLDRGKPSFLHMTVGKESPSTSQGKTASWPTWTVTVEVLSFINGGTGNTTTNLFYNLGFAGKIVSTIFCSVIQKYRTSCCLTTWIICRNSTIHRFFLRFFVWQKQFQFFISWTLTGCNQKMIRELIIFKLILNFIFDTYNNESQIWHFI